MDSEPWIETAHVACRGKCFEVLALNLAAGEPKAEAYYKNCLAHCAHARAVAVALANPLPPSPD